MIHYKHEAIQLRLSLPQRIFQMACKANCNCYLTNLVGIDPKCTRFDMTDLYRVTITDDMTPEDKELFQGYNDNCEAVEDLWIELDFQLWEQMEQASKKLQNRNAKQRERDNRDQVKQLHKQGFSLAEIASITKLSHGEVYDFVHAKRKGSDLFDDCPSEIMQDLGEVFDF